MLVGIKIFPTSRKLDMMGIFFEAHFRFPRQDAGQIEVEKYLQKAK